MSTYFPFPPPSPPAGTTQNGKLVENTFTETKTTAVVLPAPVLQACTPTLNVHILEEKIDLEFEFEIGLKNVESFFCESFKFQF